MAGHRQSLIVGVTTIVALSGPLIPRRVQASPTLEWQAPPELCPSAKTFAQRVAALEEAGRLSEVRFAFRAQHNADGSWQLVVREGDLPLRRIAGEDCQALFETALLFISLSLIAGEDPDTRDGEPAPASSPDPTPTPASTSSPADPVQTAATDSAPVDTRAQTRASGLASELAMIEAAPRETRRAAQRRLKSRTPAPRRPREIEGRAGFSVGMGVGNLPAAQPEMALDIGLRGRAFSVRSGARARPWATTLRNPSDPHRTHFSVWSGYVDLCGHVALGPRGIELPLCAGSELGIIRAKWQGSADARAELEPWWSLSASAGLSLPITAQLAFRADVGVVVAPLFPQFSVAGREPELVCCRPVGARVHTALEWKLGRGSSSRRGSRSAQGSRSTSSARVGHPRSERSP